MTSNSQHPSLGRIVIYRSRTGDYDLPAIVNATKDSLNPKGVEAGYVPDLSSPTHVHLTVFSPGRGGLRKGAEDFKVTSPFPVSENVSGCYQEWDIAYAYDPDEERTYGESMQRIAEVAPGTWRWPHIIPATSSMLAAGRIQPGL